MAKSIFLFAAVIAVACMSCESGIDSAPSAPTMTFLGTTSLISLNGDTIASPYDSVQVSLLFADNPTAGYTETALTNGFWAFRKVRYSSYDLVAGKRGYGRTDVFTLDSVPRDTIRLTLAEQPHVQPTLDSVQLDTTGFEHVYRLFVRTTLEGNAKLSAIVQEHAGDTNMRFIPYELSDVTGSSGRYIIELSVGGGFDNRSISQSAFVGTLAYNPKVGRYSFATDSYGNHVYRYQSEGPLSNFLPVPK